MSLSLSTSLSLFRLLPKSKHVQDHEEHDPFLSCPTVTDTHRLHHHHQALHHVRSMIQEDDVPSYLFLLSSWSDRSAELGVRSRQEPQSADTPADHHQDLTATFLSHTSSVSRLKNRNCENDEHEERMERGRESRLREEDEEERERESGAPCDDDLQNLHCG